MVNALRDVAVPVVGNARTDWDQAVDAALRKETEWSVWLDSFQNNAGTRTDRQMFGDALTYAAAQTQPPAIKLAPRDHDLSASATTGYNGFPGFCLAGPRNQGIGTIEQGTAGAACRVKFNGGSGTQSLFYMNNGGASMYSPMVCHDIAFYSTNNVSQWLHAPYSAINMYGPIWGNLEFTGFYRSIGQPGDAATITLAVMYGAWNIPSMSGTPLSFRGSDNWLVPDEANIGWDAGPAGQYLVRFENVLKTFVRGLYLTCRQGGTRAILVDNQSSYTQGGLFISDCVIEGQNYSEPAAGALVYINSNGQVTLHHCALNFAMANPTAPGGTDTAYIMAALSGNGLLNVHDITVNRAGTVGQNVPIIAQTGGGRVYAKSIYGMSGNTSGQAWTDLPAVTSSAGYMEIDQTLRVV